MTAAITATATVAREVESKPKLSDFRRIVVKVGSSLVVDAGAGQLRRPWLEALVDDLAALHKTGADVLVVSSGSIALGRSVLKLPRGALKLEDSQAAAAVGQIALASLWSELFARHAIVAGQILVTFGDTEERRRYLNARATVERLLAMRAAPIFNENDSVATAEIRYGDNDRLAARIATMASADCLVLLSDVAGLYDAPPQNNPQAQLIAVVPHIDAAIEAMAGGAASEFSRGGMRTKIEAAKIATIGGAHMAIADGRISHPLAAIGAGGPCTWFLTPSNPITARKKWIAGSLEPKGVLHIDAGAARALHAGNSLLPAGVKSCEGGFSRGDCVVIRDETGAEIGRGLINYDVEAANRILGRSSREIETILKFSGRAEMIHRDDMILAAERSFA